MVYELKDTSRVEALFESWNETLIYSCLQRVMGKVFVTDKDSPISAMAFVGCFAFYAGQPDRELVINKPDGFVIMTPKDDSWASLIEDCFPMRERSPDMPSEQIRDLTGMSWPKWQQDCPKDMSSKR